MAKSTASTATEPTIAPPPAESDPFPSVPDPPGTYPEGVSMVESGALPNTTDRAQRFAREPRDPKGPPPGWAGTFNRCGACGDFIGNLDRCPACSPALSAPRAFNVERPAR